MLQQQGHLTRPGAAAAAGMLMYVREQQEGPASWGGGVRLLLPFQGRGEGPVPSNASGSQGLVPSDDEQRMAAHMKDSSMSITERRIAEGCWPMTCQPG